MANLNLSQFGEKLFVADADHTFIWDSAASISKKVSRNSWLNSGTLTSDAPVTISQTWNQIGTTFTAFKVNAVSTASASGSLLLDLQVGGVSQFKVDKSGVATLSADGVPQLRMISVTGSGSVFNGLTLESSLSTLAGFLVNRSTGEVKIGGLSNAGYFPTFYSNNAERMRITTAGNVGIGTTSPTSKLHVAETWNAAGTTFAAAKIVVTDTASAAASNLLELWSGSTPALKSYVTKSGSFVGGVVGANQPSALSFPNSGSYSVGIYNPASYKIQFSMSSADPGGVAAGAYSGLQYEMTAGVLSWGTTAQDIVLLRDGEADHLAMRRSTNGQKFSVYGTYPGAAWERFTITAPTSGNVLLGTYKGTGGIARGLEFQTDGVTRMSITAAGTQIVITSGTQIQRNDGGGAIYDFNYHGVQFANIDGLGMSWSTIAGPASSKHVGIFGYASEQGVVQINSTVKDTFRDLRVRSVIQQPPATITPSTNGDLVVEATSNTTLTFKLKGTDGTVRSGTITLA